MKLINYSPPPVAEKFILHLNPGKPGLIMGPLGSGKTTAFIMKTLYIAANVQRPAADGIRYTKFAYIRNTRQQLKDTTYASFIKWFPDGSIGRWRETDSTYQVRTRDVHCDILFRALDRPEDQTRVLSLEVTGAVFNEQREIDHSLYTAMRGRCGRYPSGNLLPPGAKTPDWWGMFGDTNPPDEDHWIYKTFYENLEEGAGFFHQPGGLEPNAENKENLPTNYYEDLMLPPATQEWIKVHVHSQWGSSLSGKPVYINSWNESFHTEENLYEKYFNNRMPIYVGFDFGRKPAAVIKQRDRWGRTLTFDEVIAHDTGLTNFMKHHFLPMLNERYQGCEVIITGDPSGWYRGDKNEQTCADVIKEFGFLPIKCITNDPEQRISATENKLGMHRQGQSTYLVDPKRCPVLVRGFNGGYKYKERRDGTFEDRPNKNDYSHPHDANQYIDLMIDNPAMTSTLYRRNNTVEIITVNRAAY